MKTSGVIPRCFLFFHTRLFLDSYYSTYSRADKDYLIDNQ